MECLDSLDEFVVVHFPAQIFKRLTGEIRGLFLLKKNCSYWLFVVGGFVGGK